MIYYDTFTNFYDLWLDIQFVKESLIFIYLFISWYLILFRVNLNFFCRFCLWVSILHFFFLELDFSTENWKFYYCFQVIVFLHFGKAFLAYKGSWLFAGNNYDSGVWFDSPKVRYLILSLLNDTISAPFFYDLFFYKAWNVHLS